MVKTRKEFRTADLRRCNVDEGSSMALVLAVRSGLVNPELLLQLDYLPPRIGSIAHICQIAYCAMQKLLTHPGRYRRCVNVPLT